VPASDGWTPADAAAMYRVDAWGKGYFAINEAGHLAVRPWAEPGREIDLLEIVDGLRRRGLTAPVLLRFSDILAHRLRQLHEVFSDAIAESEYRGRYVAAYPIKVNQQRHVVEEMYRFGGPYGFGLEVGSKPELLVVMAMTDQEPDRLIVCNGFKDERYMEAVILAGKLGRAVIPVIENFEELRLLIRLAQRYGVRPRIGVRVKLATTASGRWRDSSGERSKFGLFISELLELLDVLRRHDMTDCLELVHCHVGSQVQDIRFLKDALNELGCIYVELVRLGARLRYVDVGGGLGVDYDGSQTNFESSMNYTLQEYAADVVHRLASACNDAGIEHPTIISESGRAMAAYHSVLVFNVLGSSGLDRFTVAERLRDEVGGEEEIPQPISDLFDAYSEMSEPRVVECFHDAVQARQESLQLFNLGYISLRLRGLVERLYWAACSRARDIAEGMETVPEELEDLEVILSDSYFCNFSVFQSLPDSWAIGQLFPVMPIHRLDERPSRKAVLVDITCDSDGRIDRFVDHEDVSRTLDLHPLIDGERYYLGAFLVGAYQETLGDLHNLFGDTHVTHIRVDDDGAWWIDEVVRGDTAREVLGYVQYDVDQLYPRLSRDCEKAMRDGRMTLEETQILLRFYERQLEGYTYLEED
jgi:arginine decarboxylase